jgi:hypothetical protein
MTCLIPVVDVRIWLETKKQNAEKESDEKKLKTCLIPVPDVRI